MDEKETLLEQKQVYVALSAFTSAMIQSTQAKSMIENLQPIRREGEVIESRKYRPAPESSIEPLDLSF